MAVSWLTMLTMAVSVFDRFVPDTPSRRFRQDDWLQLELAYHLL